MSPDAYPQSREIAAKDCAGKAAYSSAASALAGMKRMKRTRKFKPHHGERLNAYRCAACQFWHLGNRLTGRSS